MVIGLLCAIAASLCYGTASVLQALSARRTEISEDLDPRFLIRMFGQLPYLIGVSLDGIGFIASVFALQLGQPLFVVQAIVAASVGVTAVIVAVMGTKLGRSEWLALAAIGLGLVLLALAAGPENDVVLGNGWYWVMLAAAVPVALIGAAGLRAEGALAAVLLGLGAGLGFAITAVASRTLRIPDPWWHLVLMPATWAIAAGGLIGMLLFALALQRVAVTTVTALVLSVETVIPSILGLAFFGDTVRSGFVWVAVLGLLLALVGAGLLARFSEVDLTPADAAPR
jgi:drug/metabolite transporter (DMT)-like permease